MNSVKNSNRIINKADYLLAEYDITKDTKYLVSLAEMLLKNELKFKLGPSSLEPMLMFKESSLYDNKCCRCEKKIYVGEPIFWFKKDYWHLQCASSEEKLNQTYYREACKKAISGDKRYAALSIALKQDENLVEETFYEEND